ARWASLNFLGRARRLELRGRVSNLLTAPLDRVPFFEVIDGVYRQVAGAVNADFRQPWFFSARNTLGAGLFAERVIVPDVFVRADLAQRAPCPPPVVRPPVASLVSLGAPPASRPFVGFLPAPVRLAGPVRGPLPVPSGGTGSSWRRGASGNCADTLKKKRIVL